MNQTLAADRQPLPPPPTLYRWIVLVFVSLAMFGNYYIYDAMGPVFDLLESQLEFTGKQLGSLYTAYSIAAIVVLLFCGILIDRWGTRKAITLFAFVCLGAAAITAVSSEYWVMFSGRFMLGMGAEPLIVAVTTALAKWFKGKELSFAFGLNLTISRLGSASADWSTAWARPLYTNWQDPLWLATAIAGVSVAGAMLYWFMENRAEKSYRLGEAGEADRLELKDIWLDLRDSDIGKGEPRLTRFRRRAWARVRHLMRYFSFSPSYWYIVALCVVFYSTVFPFRAFAIYYFQQAHGLERDMAGKLSSLLPFASMIATPLFGILVDRVGKRSFFMALGSMILLPLFLIVTYAPPGPEISLNINLWILGTLDIAAPLTLFLVMLLLGLAFSLIPAVMWPSVAYIVEQKRLGSGYALMTLCQQVGMGFVPWFIGFLNDRFEAGPENTAGYAPGMWTFTVLASLGLFFSFMLWRAEKGPQAHGLETITTKKAVQ